MNDINTLEDDINDSREVQFTNSDFKYKGSQKCMIMTVRNLMNYPVEVDPERNENPAIRKYDIEKKTLPNFKPKFQFKASDERILTNIKPTYEVFEELYSANMGECPIEMCLNPNEMAELHLCMKPESLVLQ